MNYTHTVTVSTSFDDSVRDVREALSREGFGILTEIDVHATFTEKLGQEAADAVGDYLILGACNPPFANRALTADATMGVFLPCNVVVRRGPGADTTTVQAIDPTTMSVFSSAPEIADVAAEVDARLRAALESLTAA